MLFDRFILAIFLLTHFVYFSVIMIRKSPNGQLFFFTMRLRIVLTQIISFIITPLKSFPSILWEKKLSLKK